MFLKMFVTRTKIVRIVTCFDREAITFSTENERQDATRDFCFPGVNSLSSLTLSSVVCLPNYFIYWLLDICLGI